jgi:hypothetical protein
MKYYVTYKIDARYVAAVEADSLEEAMKKGQYEYYDADFGVARDINAEAIMVED